MNLVELSQLANRVGAEDLAFNNAKHVRTTAEDELLNAFVDAIRPALPAMSSKVVFHEIEFGGPYKAGILIDSFERLYLGYQGDWFTLTNEGATKSLDAKNVLDMIEIGPLTKALLKLVEKQSEGVRKLGTEVITTEIECIHMLRDFYRGLTLEKRNARRLRNNEDAAQQRLARMRALMTLLAPIILEV